jgi:hypothetical protein
MEGEITDDDRAALVRCAVSRVGRDEMKAALVRTNDPAFQAPKAVTNALNALRKHRDPAGVVTRPQYRVALPFLAAVVADASLNKTIEVLGDHSDDPTREELLEALDEVRGSFSDVTIAAMLASVADSDMPASDLCFAVATEDERFGLTDWAEQGTGPKRPAASSAERATTPEQREARRLKKQKDAEERRRKMEAARKAGEQVRRARKQERSSAASAAASAAGQRQGRPGAMGEREASVAPRLTRRASLTPAQEEEFDRNDPWTAGVVFAWVTFDSADPDQPELEGKSRRCVVVAGSPTNVLVRPGYSEGGMKSRDWKSVALRHWKQAGFDQPTWIDSETLQVPRPEDGPLGWLAPEDWNALW